MENNSGIYPSNDRVLVFPDEVEETYGDSGIVIVNKDAYEIANSTGILVAVGPDAWDDYGHPGAEVGERVIFVKYSGKHLPGKDGKAYRMVNDRDILARCDPEVDLVDFKPRERLGGKASAK